MLHCIFCKVVSKNQGVRVKRTADMMSETVVEETIQVSSDVFEKLSRELRLPADLLQILLSKLKYTQEQKAILSKSSITHDAAEKKLLTDVFAALRFTDEQIEWVSKALLIPEIIIVSVREHYSMRTIHIAMRFLTELHRYGMMFHEGKLHTYINSVFIPVNEPQDRLAKNMARSNSKTIAGFHSYDELNAKYHEQNGEAYSNKYSYLLWRYTSPENRFTEDEKIRHVAVKAANDAFCHGCFIDVTTETARQALRSILIDERTGENCNYSTRRRNRGLTFEQAEKFATIYIDLYSQRFWSMAQYVYDALKHATQPKDALIKMSVKDFSQKDLAPASAELMNEVNSNSAIWKETKEVLVKIFVKIENSKHVNRLCLSIYGSGANNNNNNNNALHQSGNSSSSAFVNNRRLT